ncbi:rRNA maturation RNase YbeY [Buchnera aphidicola]|uniref:rRNA maturation RNase YbeY n=1 Tax=Buchnera aphidicola TaxID=9 RepID=UPI0012AB40D3|nr:rRNA maturation RNase YbeY [Buchnera aphidicola]
MFFPDKKYFLLWLKKIFKKNKVEITIRLVSIKEITYLNKKYRKKNVPTNVLSFPSTENINIKHQFSNYIGDIILSPNYINKEALLLKKNRLEHWAHIIIHSALHLLHYTHKNKKSRNIMQNIEKKIMIQLGFDDPYKTSNIN